MGQATPKTPRAGGGNSTYNSACTQQLSIPKDGEYLVCSTWRSSTRSMRLGYVVGRWRQMLARSGQMNSETATWRWRILELAGEGKVGNRLLEMNSETSG